MVGAVSDALYTLFERTGFMEDTVALAWGVIATGPGLDTLLGGVP